MKADDRSIEDWIAAIEQGRLQLPRFQRFEAWGPRPVADLLETVLDDLPCGAATVLQVAGNPTFKTRQIESAPSGRGVITELLLDGQQRLTAFWRSLTDSYEDGTFHVSLDRSPEPGRFHRVVHQARWVASDGRKFPLWANRAKETLERRLIPVRLLRPGSSGEVTASEWIDQATEGDAVRARDLDRLIGKLREQMAHYNFPLISLPPDTERDVVLDVFVKINTSSVSLTAFDVIVAQVEGELGHSLHDRVDELIQQVPAIERYVEPPNLLLNGLALLQDRVPNQSGYFSIDWTKLEATWPILVEGARRMVEFLEQERVFDADRLPSVVPLPVLLALWAHAPSGPDQLGNARVLIRQYLWYAFFTARYESASATASLQDYRELAKAIQIGARSSEAPIFGDELPSPDQLMAAGWPRKRDRLGRAILLLSFQGGALDIADGAEITSSNVRRREYHHLFPVALLKRVDGTVNPDLALNCALLTWRTNRTISDSPPAEYLAKRADEALLGDAALRHRLATHALDYASLVDGGYSTFLTTRATVYAEAIRRLCEGEPWSLPFPVKA